MIPKIIHYCWFGRNPLPELAIKCINSWKQYFPEYQIIEWNEDNFDVHIIPYTSEAYKLKKYAFVSDYARFWILYKYGGLYFDTDVEIIKNMDDIIARGPFMGCELSPVNGGPLIPMIAPGLGLGSPKGLPLYKEILDNYTNKHFMSLKGLITGTVVQIVSKILLEKQNNINLNNITHINNIYIYPHDYFCPLVAQTKELYITENTRSIHHYTASWTTSKKMPRIQRLYIRLNNIFIRITTQIQFLLKKRNYA